ncbi:precorrin-8X methylmutase [Oculatella sp. LEGE 06141]|nr:precorrin-8X methylmutase [Oculatella sp. LEGE 06141]
MTAKRLTIKELTDAAGGHVTPRMVRHYHDIGLLPPPERSPGNYRLYTEKDVQRLNRIVALRQQGFQLSHIQHLLSSNPGANDDALLSKLQQHYRTVMQQLNQLRQTASALERVLGHDSECHDQRTAAIAQLQCLELEAKDSLSTLETVWDQFDAATANHPEAFSESLQHLLPDLSDRSEIEVDLLSKLVLACGDVGLIPLVQISQSAIAAARAALKAGCPVVVDVPAIAAALDQTRLAHLGCTVTTLIDNPHITTALEAEQAFWQRQPGLPMIDGAILVVGYAPSVLLSICDQIDAQALHPALVIGLPIGFSHAPAAKRRLARSSIPSITVQGALGGGLLAAVALNALMDSLIEKPDCHCYLLQERQSPATSSEDVVHHSGKRQN